MDIKLTKLLFTFIVVSSFFIKQKKSGAVVLKANESFQNLLTDKDLEEKENAVTPDSSGIIASLKDCEIYLVDKKFPR